MVVAVASHDVEHHTSESLFLLLVGQDQFLHGREKLAVGIHTLFFVVQMAHGTKALNVMPHTATVPVKTLGHEVGATVFMEQAAFHHVQPCRLGHEVVRVLDAAVIRRSAELIVSTHTVEFQEPMFKAWRRVELASLDLIGFAVPGDPGLGAAGRSPHIDDAAQGCISLVFALYRAFDGFSGLVDQVDHDN